MEVDGPMALGAGYDDLTPTCRRLGSAAPAPAPPSAPPGRGAEAAGERDAPRRAHRPTSRFAAPARTPAGVMRPGAVAARSGTAAAAAAAAYAAASPSALRCPPRAPSHAAGAAQPCFVVDAATGAVRVNAADPAARRAVVRIDSSGVAGFSVGAGGGSIAKGGKAPAVSDANCVLGNLPRRGLLGGDFRAKGGSGGAAAPPGIDAGSEPCAKY
eukprot:gene8401-4466_t